MFLLKHTELKIGGGRWIIVAKVFFKFLTKEGEVRLDRIRDALEPEFGEARSKESGHVDGFLEIGGETALLEDDGVLDVIKELFNFISFSRE
jgi:hypothetical protein